MIRDVNSHYDRPVLAQDAIEVVNYFLDLRENLRERFLSIFDIGSIEKQYLEGPTDIHLT